MTHPKLATAQSGYSGRGYRVPGHLDAAGGKLVYPSVTTILKRVAKPGLTQWVADQVAAYAVANVRYLMTHSEDVSWRYLRFFWSREPDLQATELRTWHEGVRDDAAELGTNLHEWIEPELDGFMEQPELDSDEARQMAEQFVLWRERHTVEAVRSEFTVVHTDPALRYAGTADGEWWITCHDPECVEVLDRKGNPTGARRSCLPEVGVAYLCLVDLKTSRYTWPEHGMQLAALAGANVVMREVTRGYAGARLHEATKDGAKVRSWWVEEEAVEYDRLVVLHLRPADLDPQGNEIPAFCRIVDFTDQRAIYARGFAGAHALAEMHKALG